MEQSRRAKRMKRNHARNKSSGLNLVSLMDIFTILVFFLLVNTSNSYQLPDAADLILPVSTSQTPPKETLVVAVTRESILLEGKSIARLTDLTASEDDIFLPLRKELSKFNVNNEINNTEKSITIMSDENIPYSTLKILLSTCQSENFNKISFAALQDDQ